jgi:hypothetical protein
MTLSKDTQHWRDRAAQMRILAASIKDSKAQAIMLKLADDYDKLAERGNIRSDPRSE